MWEYEEPDCESSYQQLFVGYVNMREKRNNSASNPYEGALLTVVPKTAPIDDLPKSFGLSLHHMVGHCALQGYASNIDGVIVLILSPGDKPIKVKPTTLIQDPALTAFKTAASNWYILTNLKQAALAKKLYERSCQNERKILQNFQRILRQTPTGNSLTPFFPEGYTSIRSANVAHVVKCHPEEITFDSNVEECYE